MFDCHRYIIRDREQSTLGESLRALRASILAAERDGKQKSILFTSAALGDSKSLTAANVAATLAYAGKQVVLMDCDLRKPMLHTFFGLPNEGVGHVALGQASLSQMLQDTSIPNLRVLPAGGEADKPAELLSDDRWKEMLIDLEAQADYVIVDSPSLVSVSDACILASKVDGVVLVLDARSVRLKTAQQVMEVLKGARARMIGAVLNDVKVDKAFRY